MIFGLIVLHMVGELKDLVQAQRKKMVLPSGVAPIYITMIVAVSSLIPVQSSAMGRLQLRLALLRLDLFLSNMILSHQL